MRMICPSLISILVVTAGASCGGDGNKPAIADAPVPTPDTRIPTRDLTVDIFNAPDDPVAAGLYFAYQDGDGAWQTAPAPVAGKLTIPLRSDRYGVAIGCVRPNATSANTNVEYGTLTESDTITMSASRCRKPTPAAASKIQGTLTTTPESSNTVDFGTRGTFAFTNAGETTAAYMLGAVPGTADLVVTREDKDGNTDRFAVERNVVVGATALTKDINVNGLAAPLRILQPVKGDPSLSLVFSTLNTASTTGEAADSAVPLEILSPPLAQLVATDTFETAVIDSTSSNDDVYIAKVTARPVALDVPTNAFAPATVSVNGTGANIKIKLTWTKLTSPGFDFYNAGASTENSFISLLWSDAWMGAASSLELPNFQTVIGWPAMLTAPITSARVSVSKSEGTFSEVGYTYTSFTRGGDVAPTLRSARSVARERCYHLGTNRERCVKIPSR
jgi:hypothetical protein